MKNLFNPLLLILVLMQFPNAYSKECSFDYGIYNVFAKKSLKRIHKKTDKSQLDPKFIDGIGCSICKEDQVKITLKNGVSFLACHKVAQKVTEVLNNSIDKGFPIKSVVGYRPQMSRGAMDKNGNRTKLSNHSFGSAIDVNPEDNGLYDKCPKWGPDCRLRMGGKWEPHKNPLSIHEDSPLVKELESISFNWGGKLYGRQKDFMHFSVLPETRKKEQF